MAASWPRPLTDEFPEAITFAPSGGGTVVVGRAGSPVPPGASGPPLDFLLDPARLPTNWLGFTSLRAVVIGPMEWERLSDAQKNALLTWTACGGELMFVDGNPKALFPQGQRSCRCHGGWRRVPLFLRRRPLSDIGVGSKRAAWTRAHRRTRVGARLELGTCQRIVPPTGALIEARGFRLPIPGVDGVPARAYLLILIVFSAPDRAGELLVPAAPTPAGAARADGAAHLSDFHRAAGRLRARRRRVGVRARAMTFTLLDQARKQAATRASISMYAAGMTPAGGLRFPRDVAVFPIGPDGTGSRERRDPRSHRFAAFLRQESFRRGLQRTSNKLDSGPPASDSASAGRMTA